ncbi:hypothetical protein GOODEAATRI_030818 [Goodea atripinnis]|uniref:Uncharacterized protein n=1 Tax=Goodea atripinnis TaxID=208336 RepID=A0ABV0NSW7_9TELE
MTTSTKKTPRKRKHTRTTYSIGVIEVCRITFQFLMGICKAKLTDIIRYFDGNGARPCLRKKSQQPQDPHFISIEQLHRVLEFIKNYAEDHAIMLPGGHPGHRDWHVKLLPTHVSKVSVWRLCMKSAKELGMYKKKIKREDRLQRDDCCLQKDLQ